MTAPLLNLPLTSPVAGAAGAAAPAQGAAAGFQVLLAAFFGAQGEGDMAAGLFGEDAAPKTEGASVETALVDPTLTPGANADALAFAAQLAAPTPQAQAATQPAATSDVSGQASAAAPPAFVAPAPPQGPARNTGKPALDAATTAEAAKPVPADARAPTAEALATPAAAKVPVQPDAKPTPEATPQAAGLTPRPADIAPPHNQPAPAPLPAPVAAAAVAEASVDEAATQVAAEIAPIAEPARERPANARSGKVADPTRKDGGQAANALADAVDGLAAANPSAPVAGAEGAAEDAFSIEIDRAAPAAREAKPNADEGPDGQAAAPSASTAATNGLHAPPPHTPVRGSPETVANLAAQIVKKLEGRSTRFDVELNPIGLGQVNVAVEIGANGKMTAAMSFETQHAANELRGRSADLQRALEQAGFDVSGGLSFDVAGDRGDGRSAWADQQQQQQANGGAWRGRAFQAVLGTAGDAAEAAAASALNLQRRTRSGVDVRI